MLREYVVFFSAYPSAGPLPGEQQWLERIDLVRHQWLRRGRDGTAERVGQLFDGGQRGKEPAGGACQLRYVMGAI